MKVFELAKHLGVTAKEVMARLRDLGFEMKNPMSVVSDEAMDCLRSGQARQVEEPAPEPAPAAAEVTPPAVEAPAPAADHAAPEGELDEVAGEIGADTKARLEREERAAVKTPPPRRQKPETIKPPPRKAAARTIQPPKGKPRAKAAVPSGPPADGVIHMRGGILVKDLAVQLGMKPNEVIAELMKLNILASINQMIDAAVARQVAEKHGFTVETERKPVRPATPQPSLEEPEEAEDRDEDMLLRPPVVTFLGHVDHGKTSLLDRIRDAKVAAGEAGGITQHIGAYTVEAGGHPITFLDTPGHAAFTAMRARGANLTDIAVIIIAADDGIMPQTREAIQHAQAAGVAVMVAINKVDLPGANVDRVKTQLQAEGLAPDDWGGETVCCPVSAHTGEGLDHLLEMIVLQADMLDLRANPRRRAEGFVVEARMEPGMGPTANVLVKRGTLKLGDVIRCGPYCGRVRALINDHGHKVKSAGPSTPVKCLGLPGVPGAGEAFKVYSNEKVARTLADGEQARLRHEQLDAPRKASLDNLFDQIQLADRVELKVVLKADTQGSVEAIAHSLREIKSDKVSLSIILSGTGNITGNDVMLASASDAIILGFHVSKEPGVDAMAKHEGVEIRLHQIIYELIDQVRDAMVGLLKPVVEEVTRGRAEVRQVFELSRGGRVAGCLVVQGTITPRYRVRVRRGKEVLGEGLIETLKHFQDTVNEVREGQECGLRLDKSLTFNTGDILEF